MTGKTEAPETGGAKRELRAMMLGKRRGMPPDALAELSRLAQLRLLEQPVWRNASGVALYQATQNEAATGMLLAAALDSGKKVFLPRVRQGERGVMDFARCRGENELVCGAYRILEPAPDLPPCVFTAPAECPAQDRPDLSAAPDLFLIPGVAFDRHGHRLGFGGGYYDRFLSSPLLRAHSLFVGFAYSFQVVDCLPAEIWDQPVHALCTDAGYEKFRR